MGCSPWDRKEPDTTERLTLSHTDTEMTSSQLPITRKTAKPVAKPGKDGISTDMVKNVSHTKSHSLS